MPSARSSQYMPVIPDVFLELHSTADPGNDGCLLGRSVSRKRVTNPIINETFFFRLSPEQRLEVRVRQRKAGSVTLAELMLHPGGLQLPFAGFVDLVPASRRGDDHDGPPVMEIDLDLYGQGSTVEGEGSTVGAGPMATQALAMSAPPGLTAPPAPESTVAGQGSTAEAPPAAAKTSWKKGEAEISPHHLTFLVNSFVVNGFLENDATWRPCILVESLKAGKSPPVGDKVGIDTLAFGWDFEGEAYEPESQLYSPAEIFSARQRETAAGVVMGISLITPVVNEHQHLTKVASGLKIAKAWAGFVMTRQLVWGPLVAHALINKAEFSDCGFDYLPLYRQDSQGSTVKLDEKPKWDYMAHTDELLEWLKQALLTLDAWVVRLDRRSTDPVRMVASDQRWKLADPDIMRQNEDLMERAFERFSFKKGLALMPGTVRTLDTPDIIGSMTFTLSDQPEAPPMSPQIQIRLATPAPALLARKSRPYPLSAAHIIGSLHPHSPTARHPPFALVEVYMSPKNLGLDYSKESWWVVSNGLWRAPAPPHLHTIGASSYSSAQSSASSPIAF